MLLTTSSDSVKPFITLYLEQFFVLIGWNLVHLVEFDIAALVSLLLLEPASFFCCTSAGISLFVTLLGVSNRFQQVCVAIDKQVCKHLMLVRLEAIHVETLFVGESILSLHLINSLPQEPVICLVCIVFGQDYATNLIWIRIFIIA